jgi:hypothetical protein
VLSIFSCIFCGHSTITPPFKHAVKVLQDPSQANIDSKIFDEMNRTLTQLSNDYATLTARVDSLQLSNFLLINSILQDLTKVIDELVKIKTNQNSKKS